jgi:hypothetical protein
MVGLRFDNNLKGNWFRFTLFTIMRWNLICASIIELMVTG